MRRSIRRILGTVAVAAMLLGVLSVAAFPGVAAAARTWYVDDSGGADFTSIQAAIDAAADGDTIIVRDGTYVENLVISKDLLTLASLNGPDYTVIEAADPEQSIVYVAGEYDHPVAGTVEGFTITGEAGTSSPAVDLDWWADGSRVVNNVIGGAETGDYPVAIIVNSAEDITISGNTILGGNVFADDSGATITGNTFSDSTIQLGFNSGDLFSGNAVSGEGSSVDAPGGSTVVNNTFTGGYGLSLTGEGNDVRNNVFTSCGLSAYAPNNTVESCLVNGKPLLYLEDASGITIDSTPVGQVVLVQCQGITVRDCAISDTRTGIQLLQSSGCTIEGNVVEGCGRGIDLWESSQNSLRLNLCEGNGSGIGLWAYSDDNLLEGNTLSGNDNGAILYSSSRNSVRHNYMGDGLQGIALGSNVGIYHYPGPVLYHVPSDNNTFLNNDVVDNANGIYLKYAEGNLIYHNNFSNTTLNAEDNGEGNLWDNGAAQGGNHWSDHACTGNPSNGSQPYGIDGDAAASDRYPFQDFAGWPPELPPVPVLASPASGKITTDSTPWLDWSDVSFPPGVTYRLQVDNNADFSSPVVSKSGVTSSSRTISPALADGTYYWKVRAVDGEGNLSAWTAAWSFTVDVVAPSAPTLLSPINGKATRDSTPWLDWSDVTDATGVKYRLQVDNNADFSSPLVNKSGLTASSRTLSTLADGVYYWRVMATDGAGNISGWSAAWSFAVDTVTPSMPALTYPANGTVTSDTTPWLDWSDVADATGVKYQLQVDNNADFSSAVVNKSGLTASSRTLGTLPEGAYYWRVRVTDGAGNTSAWAAAWSFTVQ